jgi:hypothetical protein
MLEAQVEARSLIAGLSYQRQELDALTEIRRLRAFQVASRKLVDETRSLASMASQDLLGGEADLHVVIQREGQLCEAMEQAMRQIDALLRN